ncbi:MAG: hypothetical protein IH802_07475, partial [Nitrospinae bacterium]|nr:hypothetical protein [Nitrospinota bacterium]
TLESFPGALSYCFGALSSIGGVAALLVPIIVLYRFRQRKIWFLFSILAFYLVFQFRFGWDWMPFFRFATPYLPLVFTLYVLFCRTIFHIPKARILFISAVVLWMVAWSLHYLKDGNISAFYQPEYRQHAYYQIARELDEITDN